ncbi:RidA family protein [Mycolicibacterium komossense]|uniref:RidA family protein n=1 Tax=Mycolicibacterium komossense TaxID=1779 RepID=A0ABT3CJL2_9MYCO|nr:RidA family protein [Mycolicibacterium komossense]MCV7229426.1 RidA family protein [Mycolicibacterium komossense]
MSTTDLATAVGDGTDRQRLMNSTWTHHIKTPFSQGWRVGNLVFTGGQLSSDEHGNVVGVGDIEIQTRNVFQSLTSVLAEAGATWDDVVKVNTYYCFDGSGDEVRANWEAMTRVRMEFLPDEGPAGTGVRVAGLMYDGFLIEAEAIAVLRG